MISVHNTTKIFRKTPVVNNVSFEIAKGEIVGFLGPNGAGKTTLMRLLTTYFPPTQGKILVNGFDVSENPMQVRKSVGYLAEVPTLYPDMTVKSYLSFAARLKDIAANKLALTVDRVLGQCAISDVKNQIIATLSKGYRQRVGIAQAIIHDPDILILDEPTSGLDPLQILQVRNLIKSFAGQKTVILSTHILPEIEQMAKHVLIMHKGAIVANQTLNDLIKTHTRNDPSANLESIFLKLTA